MIARIFITALILLIGFRIVYFLIQRIPLERRLRKNIRYIFPALELMTWLAFCVWVIGFIYETMDMIGLVSTGIIFIIIAAAVFNISRDFFLGIFLKMQNKIDEGTFIEIEEMKGVVKKAGHLRLDIINEQGDIDSIPYNRLRSKIISRPGSNPNLEKIELEFMIPADGKLNRLLSELKIHILCTPWVAVSQLPIIEHTETESGKIKIIIGVYALNKSYAENIKDLVETRLMNELKRPPCGKDHYESSGS